MTKKELNIVETAFGLFAHYGVKKTTMSEIASAANVARQTVYNAFENKEELVYSALKHYAEKTMANVEEGCADLPDPEARLDVLFTHMVDVPFEAMQRLPHLDEILEVGESLPSEKKQEIAGYYKEGIRLALLPFEARLQENGIHLPQLQDFMKAAFTKIKGDADNAEHLVALLAPLRAMLIVCLRSPC